MGTTIVVCGPAIRGLIMISGVASGPPQWTGLRRNGTPPGRGLDSDCIPLRGYQDLHDFAALLLVVLFIPLLLQDQLTWLFGAAAIVYR